MRSCSRRDRSLRPSASSSDNGSAGRNGINFRNLVDLRVAHAEHATRIAHDGLRGHRAVRDDLADFVAPIFVRDVVDHFVAAIHAEIDVEVGHRHAFGIEESLEQQSIREWIEIGDAETVSDERTGARTAAWTDGNVVRLRPINEIGDDEKVSGESHFDDDVEFRLEPLLVIGDGKSFDGRVFGEPRGESVARLRADERVDRLIVRNGKCRQIIFSKRQFQIASLRNLDAVLQDLRQIGE